VLSGIEWIDEVLTQPTDPQIEAEIAVIEAEDAALVTAEVRRKARYDRGCTPDAMVEALWLQQVKGNSAAVDALEGVYDAVDAEFPMLEP